MAVNMSCHHKEFYGIPETLLCWVRWHSSLTSPSLMVEKTSSLVSQTWASKFLCSRFLCACISMPQSVFSWLAWAQWNVSSLWFNKFDFWLKFHLHTVASNSLWPEYEMINEDESEYDTEMSEVNGQTNALVSKTGVDDTMKSLLDSFEVLTVLLIWFEVVSAFMNLLCVCHW